MNGMSTSWQDTTSNSNWASRAKYWLVRNNCPTFMSLIWRLSDLLCAASLQAKDVTLSTKSSARSSKKSSTALSICSPGADFDNSSCDSKKLERAAKRPRCARLQAHSWNDVDVAMIFAYAIVSVVFVDIFRGLWMDDKGGVCGVSFEWIWKPSRAWRSFLGHILKHTVWVGMSDRSTVIRKASNLCRVARIELHRTAEHWRRHGCARGTERFFSHSLPETTSFVLIRRLLIIYDNIGHYVDSVTIMISFKMSCLKGNLIAKKNQKILLWTDRFEKRGLEGRLIEALY